MTSAGDPERAYDRLVPLRRRAAAADRHTFELVDDGFDDEPDLDGLPPGTVAAAGLAHPAERVRPAGRVHPVGAAGSSAGTSDDLDAATVLADLGRAAPGATGPDRLHPDPGHGDDGPGAPLGGGGTGAPASASPRRRRAVVATAAAVVVVLGGMTAVDAITQRVQTARLREAPGGLAPIGDAPEVVWELDVDMSTQGLGAVTGAIVLNEGDDVVGYDLDTGEEAWRATFDGPTSCGLPAQYYSAVAVSVQESMTCLPATGGVEHGPRPASGWDPVPVAVLADDGTTIAARDLLPPSGPVDGTEAGAEVRWLRPTAGPDGTLLWVGRVGPEAEQQGDTVQVDESTGNVRILGDPPDVALALQDVASGEVRWTAVVPATVRDQSSYECALWVPSDGGAVESATADLDQAWGFGSDRGVHVQGCGVTASFTPDGVRTDDPAVDGDVAVAHGDGYLRDPSAGSVMYGVAGLYDASGEPLRSALLAADGSVAWEAPGVLVPPLATDGRSELRFVRTDLTLSAFDRSGAELWEPDVDGTPDQVLVATADAVLVSGFGGLSALDPATGRARWSVEPAALADAGFSVGSVMQAFTDGRTALLVVSTSAPSLVAVDLADGRVLWNEEGTRDAWSYLSVQGRLLSVGEDSVALLH